ncbi:MAG: 50S ribosomal protein L23 [Candidatus Omnitrophica bacterium]|jgi:large subunit ribosomal protein L23|nr:50S ribosomal protein L23 [Candidatus Omnitrophota bacterium]
MAEVTSIYSVLKYPLISEKASKDAALGKYVFVVDNNANVIEIKKAVEKIYKVKVLKINTSVVKGKIKRVRYNQPGRTSNWKKAVITLKKGFEIKLG